MEVEIGRVNLFDSLESVRRTSTKVFCFGLLVIVSGLIFGTPLIAHIGWAVAGIALILGLGTAIFKQLFAARIPFEIVDKER
jgi:hypothetical protein